MAYPPVVVTGVDELDKALSQLEPKLQRKITKKATRKATKDIVLPAARALVPVKTGALRRSLTVRTFKSRGRDRVGHQVQTRDQMFSGDQYYGGFAEFGTKFRKTKKGHERGVMPEFSYLRKALYDNQTRVRLLFREALLEFIREA